MTVANELAATDHLVTSWLTAMGTRVTLRPIRPEDAPMEQAFVRALSTQSRYFRFMGSLRELSPQMLLRFTQIDYDRKMAFVAVVPAARGDTQIGVCRYAAHADGERCEFAVAIADDWQRRGLGGEMMTKLIDYARMHGFRTMFGDVLVSNGGMLTLCASLGFSINESDEGPSVKHVVLALTERGATGPTSEIFGVH